MTDSYTEIELPGLRWSAGAPEPFLVSSEDCTLFAFIPPDTEVHEHTELAETYRVAEFVRCVSVRFGFPNDEVRAPMLKRGLALYGVNQVRQSDWLKDLRAVESKHPFAPRTPFPSAHHWVLTFHDSTLEAIADDITVHGDFIGRAVALASMAEVAGLR